jgi:hypothetical protein
MIEDYAPILYSKWEEDEQDVTKIRGNWAEDDSTYVIIVPAQLRSLIIKLQNSLQAKYIEKLELEKAIENIDKSFSNIIFKFKHADT